MGYGLGVDLGTTHTAAAVDADGHTEAVPLGSHRPEMPSTIYLQPDGTVLVGEAAQRRGDADPARLARESKRRMGDPVPIMVGGTPFSAHALTARLLAYVVRTVARARDAAPDHIVVSHPANWGPYKRELLGQAAQLADLPEVTLRPEPEAAAVRFASTARVAEGEIIAVYDLGGGTFDAAVLQKSADGFILLGEPCGVEQLGGVDFDEAVVEHVRATLGAAVAGLDPEDDQVHAAMARLRRDCVDAKEALSFDTEAVVPVALPRLHTRVRINRAEFESMIRPALEDTIGALRRALRSAGVPPDELRCIVLAGGSSRIPLVGELLATTFDRPVVLDEQPELGIALGAALLAGRPAGPGQQVAAARPRIPGPRRPVSGAGGPVAEPPPAPATTSAPPAASTPPAARAALPSPATRPPPAAEPPPAATPPGMRADAATGTSAGLPEAPAPRPGAVLRDRLRTYRWPLTGGLVVVVVAVTAATAWPRSGDKPATPASAAPTPPAMATLLWQAPTGSAATGPPALAAQHVVVAGVDGRLRGLRRTDGRLAWTREAGTGTAAVVADGVAYATTADGLLMAVDAGTGEVRWRRETEGRFAAGPSVAGPRVYAGGRDTVLYAFQLENGRRRWRVWTEAEIAYPPVVAGDLLVVAGADGRLYGVDDAGAIRWRRPVGRMERPPVAAGDAVCATVTGGTVTCVRAADGRRPVEIRLAGTALSGLAGDGDSVFAAAADHTVGAWDPRTGLLRWQYRPTAPAAPGAARIAWHEGQLRVSGSDGQFAGLDAGTGRERWRHTVADTFDVAPGGDARTLIAIGRSGMAYALAVPPSPAPRRSPSAAPSFSPTPSPVPAAEAFPETEPAAATRAPRRQRSARPEPTVAATTPPTRGVPTRRTTPAVVPPPTTPVVGEPSIAAPADRAKSGGATG